MKDIIKETSEITGVSMEVVEKIVKTWMYFIRQKITKIPYRNLTTFEGVKTNFSLPGFGKLVVKNKTDKRLQNEKRFKTITN